MNDPLNRYTQWQRRERRKRLISATIMWLLIVLAAVGLWALIALAVGLVIGWLA